MTKFCHDILFKQFNFDWQNTKLLLSGNILQPKFRMHLLILIVPYYNYNTT